jgi:hypothetical protein
MAFAKLFNDAIWTWFSDPRAVVYNGHIYAGFVRGKGNVTIAKINLTTGVRTSYTPAVAFQVDDHNNPVITFTSNGRLAIFYSKHNDAANVRMRISTNPEDITAWSAEFNVPDVTATGTDHGTTYCNPVVLADEANRLYVFFRGSNWYPVVVYSDDWDTAGTPTWSTPRDLFNGAGAGQRPYLKYASDDAGKIHFLANAGAGDEVAAGACHLYHWYYDAGDGNFHTSDGTVIRSLASLATTGVLTPSEVTKVYDATSHSGGGNGDSLPWSMELDGSGNPVVAYTVFQTIDDNDYHYARWDGSAWQRHTILSGQGSLYGAGNTAQDRYVGGLCVDPRDTSRLWLANDSSGQWEIEKWVTSDGGANWTTTAVTSGSSTKNARPFCPRNWSTGAPEAVWWRGASGAANGGYVSYTSFKAYLCCEPGVITKSYRQVVVDAGPVEWVPLDDTSGTTAVATVGGNGTYINAPTLAASPAILGGTAVTFNGTDERVDLPDVSATEGSFTLEAWFKLSDTNGNPYILSEASTTSNNPIAAIALNAGQVSAFLRGNTGGSVTVNPPSGMLDQDDGVWHHCASTWDGTTLRLYLDGRFLNSGTGTPGTRSMNTATVAALRRAAVSLWFPGTIDEPAIYTRALTLEEINSHFEAAEIPVVTRKSLTPVTTTDQAQSLDRITRVSLTPAATTDQAQALSFSQGAQTAVSLTPATTTDVAQTLTARRTFPLAPAATTDAAQPLSSSRQATLGPASTTDVAQPLDAVTRVSLVPATTTDQAVGLGDLTQVSLQATTTTDQAQPLRVVYRVTLTPATTTDQAQALLQGSTFAIVAAGTTDTAVGLTAERRATLTPAFTTDTGVSLTARKLLALTAAATTDVAHELVFDLVPPPVRYRLTPGVRTADLSLTPGTRSATSLTPGIGAARTLEVQ